MRGGWSRTSASASATAGAGGTTVVNTPTVTFANAVTQVGMPQANLTAQLLGLGGATPERRLDIMKDSRIGSYGGIALGLALLMRWSALATLLGAGACGLALIPAILSRAAMGLVMAALPNARAGGLAAAHGKPPMAAAVLGAGLALVLALASGAAGMVGRKLTAALLKAGRAVDAAVVRLSPAA